MCARLSVALLRVATPALPSSVEPLLAKRGLK